MSYRLTDLVDLGSLRALLESLHHATGILQGLVAADGEVLTDIGWQDVCTRFHRVHPCTNARCQAATRSLAGRAISAPFVGARCGNGLTEYAAAVVVEGDHLATLFFQVLHEPPDLEVFRAQARECGFDEQAYVAAIRAVPVMPTERHRARDELERQARTDFLTGLPNRRRLFEVAKDELDRAARYGRPFSVLMIDLDHFKDINDAHGHEGGDAVLRAIAETLRETVRGLDTMGRLGGEEFAAVLPEASLQGALETAERLRLAVERARPTLPDGARASVTVSIGVAALTDGVLDLETVFARADEALYAAKAAGRNRVRSLSGLAPARAARP